MTEKDARIVLERQLLPPTVVEAAVRLFLETQLSLSQCRDMALRQYAAPTSQK